MDVAAAYVVLWDFQCHPDKTTEFLEAYGPEGEWATLFKQGEGYIRTELLADAKEAAKYRVADYWQTELHYMRFKKQFTDPYKALDNRCTLLTRTENFAGAFHLCQ